MDRELIQSDSRVKTVLYYCECGNGGLHGRIVALLPDYEAKMNDPRFFFVSDLCSFEPDPHDVLRVISPGYRVFYASVIPRVQGPR
jgi:hypothetical protein